MESNRATILKIYSILKEHNSEDKAINVRSIMEELRKRDNLPSPPDKKTVKKHVDELMKLSDEDLLECTIEKSAKKAGHYFSRPLFEESEIKMLCDAVAFSRFIDKKYSEDLIGKLGKTIGVDWLHRYHHLLQMKDRGKVAFNDEFFLSIESLSEAIEKKCKAELVYLKYDIHKKLVPVYQKNNGVITVHPYSLIWTLNHYYLFCEIEQSGQRRFLRVDKISNVTLLEDSSINPLPASFQLTKYITNQAFMFGGEPRTISLRCRMDILGQVIDFFGEDADIRPLTDTHFELHVTSSLESMKYWVLQYITAIDDIRPKELRNMVLEFLEDALKRNQPAMSEKQEGLPQ